MVLGGKPDGEQKTIQLSKFAWRVKKRNGEMNRNFREGEVVVFAMQKRGVSPGPRAKNIHSSQKGDDYSYIVDKYWRVGKITGDELLLITRRGKTHQVPCDDIRIRRPNLWEHLFMRSRFPEADSTSSDGNDSDSRQSIGAAS